MSEDLKFKLSKITDALEGYESGKPLPINISEIHFVLGACNKLISNIRKLEQTYKTDLGTAHSEVDKFRNKWKEARQISTRLNNEIMSLRQIMRASKELSWLRKSKKLKLVINLYDASIKKFSNPSEPVPLPKVF